MPEPSLTPTGFAALDECCDRFEAAWKARPRIGDFLPAANTAPGCRLRALRELLLLDIHYRRQRGETPSGDDYLVDLPDETDVVREALASACAGTSRYDLGNASTIPLAGGSAGPAQLADWSANRFRILGSHAKGGLGEVFLAEDREFQREVALKEIQAPFLEHASARRRFALEGTVTGQLEHPGIVPVYSLGVYPDGRPFYAMRLIRGQSLSAAIRKFHEERKRQPESAELELRQLLGRFVQVCNAVAYAHSRGVIHRDIKPSNIMLGDFSETLLVDWGLAKRRGQQEAAPEAGDGDATTTNTQQGSWLGTPGYMSPEQAAGDVGRIGPASDVYSLGATLYHLLTGKASIQGNVPDTLREQIRTGDFEPPRQVQSWIPKPLEAICLKAMHLDLADRYPSSPALAADIEHWLADEPVSCLAEPVVVRTRRWVKRHPALVVGTAATVLISLASLGAIASIVGQTNRTLSKKNLELEAANGSERAATELAQTNERTAEENATVAREQSQLALKSLESVIVEIQSKLRSVPGGGELRRSLLTTALARLDDVSKRFVTRETIDRNAMLALVEMGEVYLRIGTDAPAGSVEGGPLSAARNCYQRARTIAEALSAANPRDGRAQRELAIVYSKIGDTQRQSGLVAAALEYYQRDVRINEQLAVAEPGDVQAQRDLSLAYNKAGDACLTLRQFEAAEDYFVKSYQIRQAILDAQPDSDPGREDLASALQRLGSVALAQGRLDESIDRYQAALDLRLVLAQRAPQNVSAQHALSGSHGNLGEVHLRSGRVAEAVKQIQIALTIRQRLAELDPADVVLQRELAQPYETLGDLFLRMGNVAQSEEHLRRALEIQQKLAGLDSTDGQAQSDLATVHNSLGHTLLEKGDHTAAIQTYQASLEIWLALARGDAANANFPMAALNCYLKLGDAHLGAGRGEQATANYQEALELCTQLAEAAPADVAVQAALSIAHEKLGDTCQGTLQLEPAFAHYEQALAIRRKLAAVAESGDTDFQEELKYALSSLGDVCLQLGRLAEARQHFEEALGIAEALTTIDPKDSRTQRLLAIAYGRLGDVCVAERQFPAALDNHQKSLRVLERLAAESPTPGSQRDLAAGFNRLGAISQQTGQPREALDYYQRSLDINEDLVAANPSNVPTQVILTISCERVGSAARELRQFEQALSAYGRGLAVLQSLEQTGQLPPENKAWIPTLEQAIEQCQLGRTARGDWQAVLEQPAAALPALLESRAISMLQEGRPADAMQAVSKLRELGSATADHLYNGACVYCLCAAAITAAEGEQAAAQSAAQSAARQQCLTDAVATLREAIAAGFKDFDYLQQDPDLAVLRELPEFQALLPATDAKEP